MVSGRVKSGRSVVDFDDVLITYDTILAYMSLIVFFPDGFDTSESSTSNY